MRELTRHRKSLLRDRVTIINRIHKLLESASVKLSSVVADIMGVSSRAMLTALVAGERDPIMLASLAPGTLVRKRAQLADALTGHFTDHHAFLLDQFLDQIDALGGLITTCDARITAANTEHETTLQRLQTVPGIARRFAEVIISEIDVDMSRFASAAHLASWARLCPGTHESAWKRRSTRTGNGNNWLRTTLLESAWA